METGLGSGSELGLGLGFGLESGSGSRDYSLLVGPPALARGHVAREAVDHCGPVGDAEAAGEIDLARAFGQGQ